MRALGGKLLGTGGPWSLEMQERVSLGPYSQRCLGPCRCRKSESACVFSSVVTVSHFWGHVEISVTLEPGSARVGLSQLTNLASPSLSVQWALDPSPPQVLERAPGSRPQAWWLEGCELLANVSQAPSLSPHPSVNSHKNTKGRLS